MHFWMEPSRRKALDPQITHIDGMGFPIQNELAHNHACGRTLHHTGTTKACCDEQVLHSRDRSQDRIVIRSTVMIHLMLGISSHASIRLKSNRSTAPGLPSDAR